MAYCTYNGEVIDYAKFVCSVVDDSTLYFQWSYDGVTVNSGAGVGVASVGVAKPMSDEAVFNVKYEVDGNMMKLNFAGQDLVLYK